jgi:hypothetical protein
VDGTYILRYHVADRAAVDERLRAEIAWVSRPPWGDQQSELFYDIHSTHADIMRRAYRATTATSTWSGTAGDGCSRSAASGSGSDPDLGASFRREEVESPCPGAVVSVEAVLGPVQLEGHIPPGPAMATVATTNRRHKTSHISVALDAVPPALYRCDHKPRGPGGFKGGRGT